MKLKKGGYRRRWAATAVLLVLLPPFCWWQNNGLVVTEYEYLLPPEQAGLDGVRIAQISDLHNKSFGGRLEKCLARVSPDLVVLTGDLVGRESRDFSAALALARTAAALAPTCYTPGNHESSLVRSGGYPALREGLEEAGVRVLENRTEALELGGGTLRVTGLLDSGFYDADPETARELLAGQLAQLTQGEGLSVVLAHRPELLETCARGGADLVFSGHAHGGQVRLPLVGGLVAPGEGLFPKRTSGMHRMGETEMIISRGLGNSVIPLRLFNRPELVVVTLRAEGNGT